MTNEEFIQSIALPGEEWRDVVGYEGRYCISSNGRVAALSSPYKCGTRICVRKQQLLKWRTSRRCVYPSVVLSNGEGQRKGILVHRLVADAFIPNPKHLPFVNHKDENTRNANVSNLEWCTHQYNCNYGTHNERMAKTISRTAYQKRKVVQLTISNDCIAVYDSIKDAADTLGISRASISICCRLINRTGHGFKWMYLSDYESQVSTSKNSNADL